ncbi:Hypothetical predicted protein [Lynx pardinus]|uniref:Uncharacterized protein n=1 Tax=Lynx pardinus TaxID=191816 RepID=A0A485NXI5_LYNPA|nr:Hypothetical predicted protein [Lynx pardinus]
MDNAGMFHDGKGVAVHINEEHVETFHEDLIFTLDTLASPNLPKIGDDLKEI